VHFFSLGRKNTLFFPGKKSGTFLPLCREKNPLRIPDTKKKKLKEKEEEKVKEKERRRRRTSFSKICFHQLVEEPESGTPPSAPKGLTPAPNGHQIILIPEIETLNEKQRMREGGGEKKGGSGSRRGSGGRGRRGRRERSE